MVDKTNWLDGHTSDDTFSVAQIRDRLTITRTDQNGGWGIDLKFRCCLGN